MVYRKVNPANREPGPDFAKGLFRIPKSFFRFEAGWYDLKFVEMYLLNRGEVICNQNPQSMNT